MLALQRCSLLLSVQRFRAAANMLHKLPRDSFHVSLVVSLFSDEKGYSLMLNSTGKGMLCHFFALPPFNFLFISLCLPILPTLLPHPLTFLSHYPSVCLCLSFSLLVSLSLSSFLFSQIIPFSPCFFFLSLSYSSVSLFFNLVLFIHLFPKHSCIAILHFFISLDVASKKEIFLPYEVPSMVAFAKFFSVTCLLSIRTTRYSVISMGDK